MKQQLAQLQTLRRIGAQRLVAVEQRLASATRAEHEATAHRDDLECQRMQALAEPLAQARAAVQGSDVIALRSLPAQRAAAAQAAKRIDAQLEPAHVALDAARQQRRDVAHALQRQRVRHEHVGRRLDAVRRTHDVLEADAQSDDALEARVGR